jgi:ankyrin repeat protein
MDFISKLFGKKKGTAEVSSPGDLAFDICKQFSRAAKAGNAGMIRQLLDKGADINSTGGGTFDFNPLMDAAFEGNTSAVKLLLEMGADPNSRNRRGVTPLMIAARDGQTGVMKVLLDKGASPHFEAVGEVSALRGAAAFGRLDAIRLLLDSGARDNKGLAFEGASQIGHQEIMNLLMKRGGLPVHSSHIADKLRCVYCGKMHETHEWPMKGDYVPVYFGETPGKFSLKVTCPNCKKDWHVYWYEDPGPIRPLDL